MMVSLHSELLLAYYNERNLLLPKLVLVIEQYFVPYPLGSNFLALLKSAANNLQILDCSDRPLLQVAVTLPVDWESRFFCPTETSKQDIV